MKRAFAYGVSVLLVIAVVVLVVEGRKPPAPWFATVATENGYDVLVQAAGQKSGTPPADETDVAAFLTSNEPMFELVSTALKMPFEIPSSMYSATHL